MLQFLNNQDHPLPKDWVRDLRGFLEDPQIRTEVDSGRWQAVLNAARKKQDSLGWPLLRSVVELVSKAGLDIMSFLSAVPEDFVAGSKDLAAAEIPGSVKVVKRGAFFRCKELREVVVFGQSLISIEESAFQFCEKLSSISIPKSLITIKPHAFEYCYSLQKIEYGGSAEECMHIKLNLRSFSEGAKIKVHCTDAVLRLYANLYSGYEWHRLA